LRRWRLWFLALSNAPPPLLHLFPFPRRSKRSAESSPQGVRKGVHNLFSRILSKFQRGKVGRRGRCRSLSLVRLPPTFHPRHQQRHFTSAQKILSKIDAADILLAVNFQLKGEWEIAEQSYSISNRKTGQFATHTNNESKGLSAKENL